MEGIVQLAIDGDLENLSNFLAYDRNILEECNSQGWTTLCGAAVGGQKEVAVLLIEAGANINIQDKEGRTPLHLSCLKGHTKVSRYLLEKGANHSIVDEVGCTPLHYAAKHGRVRITHLLAEFGAQIHTRDHWGLNALQWACINGHNDVIEALADRGAILTPDPIVEGDGTTEPSLKTQLTECESQRRNAEARVKEVEVKLSVAEAVIEELGHVVEGHVPFNHMDDASELAELRVNLAESEKKYATLEQWLISNDFTNAPFDFVCDGKLANAVTRLEERERRVGELEAEMLLMKSTMMTPKDVKRQNELHAALEAAERQCVSLEGLCAQTENLLSSSDARLQGAETKLLVTEKKLKESMLELEDVKEQLTEYQNQLMDAIAHIENFQVSEEALKRQLELMEEKLRLDPIAKGKMSKATTKQTETITATATATDSNGEDVRLALEAKLRVLETQLMMHTTKGQGQGQGQGLTSKDGGDNDHGDGDGDARSVESSSSMIINQLNDLLEDSEKQRDMFVDKAKELDGALTVCQDLLRKEKQRSSMLSARLAQMERNRLQLLAEKTSDRPLSPDTTMSMSVYVNAKDNDHDNDNDKNCGTNTIASGQIDDDDDDDATEEMVAELKARLMKSEEQRTLLSSRLRQLEMALVKTKTDKNKNKVRNREKEREEIHALVAKLSNCNNRLFVAESERDELIIEATKSKALISDFQQLIQALQSRIADTENKLFSSESSALVLEEVIVTEKEDYEQRLEALQTELVDTKLALQTELVDTKLALQDLQVTYDELEKRYTDVKVRVDVLEAENSHINKVVKEFEAREVGREDYTMSLMKELAVFKELNNPNQMAVERQMDDMKAMVSQLQGEISSLQKQLQQSKTDVSRASIKITTVANIVARIMRVSRSELKKDNNDTDNNGDDDEEKTSSTTTTTMGSVSISMSTSLSPLLDRIQSLLDFLGDDVSSSNSDNTSNNESMTETETGVLMSEDVRYAILDEKLLSSEFQRIALETRLSQYENKMRLLEKQLQDQLHIKSEFESQMMKLKSGVTVTAPATSEINIDTVNVTDNDNDTSSSIVKDSATTTSTSTTSTSTIPTAVATTTPTATTTSTEKEKEKAMMIMSMSRSLEAAERRLKSTRSKYEDRIFNMQTQLVEVQLTSERLVSELTDVNARHTLTEEAWRGSEEKVEVLEALLRDVNRDLSRKEENINQLQRQISDMELKILNMSTQHTQQLLNTQRLLSRLESALTAMTTRVSEVVALINGFKTDKNDNGENDEKTPTTSTTTATGSISLSLSPLLDRIQILLRDFLGDDVNSAGRRGDASDNDRDSDSVNVKIASEDVRCEQLHEKLLSSELKRISLETRLLQYEKKIGLLEKQLQSQHISYYNNSSDSDSSSELEKQQSQSPVSLSVSSDNDLTEPMTHKTNIEEEKKEADTLSELMAEECSRYEDRIFSLQTLLAEARLKTRDSEAMCEELSERNQQLEVDYERMRIEVDGVVMMQTLQRLEENARDKEKDKSSDHVEYSGDGDGGRGGVAIEHTEDALSRARDHIEELSRQKNVLEEINAAETERRMRAEEAEAAARESQEEIVIRILESDLVSEDAFQQVHAALNQLLSDDLEKGTDTDRDTDMTKTLARMERLRNKGMFITNIAEVTSLRLGLRASEDKVMQLEAQLLGLDLSRSKATSMGVNLESQLTSIVGKEKELSNNDVTTTVPTGVKEEDVTVIEVVDQGKSLRMSMTRLLMEMEMGESSLSSETCTTTVVTDTTTDTTTDTGTDDITETALERDQVARILAERKQQLQQQLQQQQLTSFVSTTTPPAAEDKEE
eukprot:gene81-100_t